MIVYRVCIEHLFVENVQNNNIKTCFVINLFSKKKIIYIQYTYISCGYENKNYYCDL